MTFDRSLLHDIRVLPSHLLVNLANSYKVKACSVRSLHLSHGLKLHNVLHVPTFKHNLLSVSLLVRQINFDLSFTKDGCVLQEPSMRKGPHFGEAAAGLYLLRDNTSKLDDALFKSQFTVSCPASNVSRSSLSESFLIFQSLLVKGLCAQSSLVLFVMRNRMRM